MHIPPWLTLLLSLPVLLLGEQLQQRIAVLSRYHIPAPVIGGLLVALVRVLAAKVGFVLDFGLNITHPLADWLVNPKPWGAATGPVEMYRPLMVAFFASLGLAAPVSLLRSAGWHLPKLLLLATTLTILQNGVALAVAGGLGQSPLLGLLCGSVSLSGGHGTALGYASHFAGLGYPQAATVGAAAATFGLVAGGLIGGPLAARLLKRFSLQSGTPTAAAAQASDAPTPRRHPSAWLGHGRAFFAGGWRSGAQLVAFIVALKLGAAISEALVQVKVQAPVYVGAIVVGILLRNLSDLSSRTRFIDTPLVQHFGALCLDLFLAMALMTLKLEQLLGTAGPMLVILLAQLTLMLSFARFITFPRMGRDYDAAVIAAGHCGFGLGATPTAIANMQAVTERFGPAPLAFLVLPIVGAFFIDIVNTAVITAYLSFIVH